jgi:hypothetical protein
VYESDIILQDALTGSGAACRRILGLLPEWFGIALQLVKTIVVR